MKKRIWMLILAAAMALVCLSAAGEELRTVYLDFMIECGAGETTMPEYPDFAGMIGEGLTDDDFDITYPVKDWVTFEADGRVTVSSDAYIGGGYSELEIVYRPKVKGVGEATAFHIRFSVLTPLTQVYMDVTSIETSMEYAGNSIETWRPRGTRADWVADISYDSRVVQVTERDNFTYKNFYVTNVGPGETDVVITAYNGMKIVIPVVVHPAPTQVTFAASYFQAVQGDTVDIGLDLGNGALVPAPILRITNDGYIYSEGGHFGLHTYFPQDASHFYAKTLGVHTITATTNAGLSGTTTVEVYGKTNTVRMEADTEPIYEGHHVKLSQYDAAGDITYARLKVTKGAELAEIQDRELRPKGYGEIEVTAYNLDGSTCVQTFEIEPYPTEIILNAEEITLEIGESFGLEVGFDKGELPWSIGLSKQDVTDQQLGTTRVAGNVITAQAPGTATYYVKAGTLTRYVTVTVPDSDKAVAIELPELPLSMGASYQLYVRDRTGEIYPAVFTCNENYDSVATITAGGYLTTHDINRSIRKLEITATLKDGRVLQVKDIEIIKRPKWLKHDAIVIRKSDAASIIATSDVGNVSVETVTVKIANEKIVKLENGYLKPKSTGKTTVTITSKFDESVSTTFTVKVISDTSSIYIGSTTITVPYGSARYLPIVTDEDGEEIAMKWAITHNNPGTGNTAKSGFVLDGDAITCTWPDATCEVTGTVKGSNEYVVVTVKGFQLPENITIEPLQVWLELGETQTLTLNSVDEYGGWGITYWESADPAIASVEAYANGCSNTVKAVAPGTTIVAAMLENGAVAGCIVNVYDTTQRLPGDVNEDGAVDEQDALIVMQYDAGWPVLINGWQGDVNADGNTNLEDAILIFQHAAGLDVQLKQYIPEK